MEKKAINDFILWEIDLPDINGSFYYVKLIDNEKGLSIFLRRENEEHRLLKIFFEEGNFLSYINTHESFVLNYWDNIPSELTGNTFYKSKKSYFIDMFHKISVNTYKDFFDITQYSIYTMAFCIDVLSIASPKIKWIKTELPASSSSLPPTAHE